MPDLVRHPGPLDHFSTAHVMGVPRAATGSGEPLMLEYQKSVFAATGRRAMYRKTSGDGFRSQPLR